MHTIVTVFDKKASLSLRGEITKWLACQWHDLVFFITIFSFDGYLSCQNVISGLVASVCVLLSTCKILLWILIKRRHIVSILEPYISCNFKSNEGSSAQCSSRIIDLVLCCLTTLKNEKLPIFCWHGSIPVAWLSDGSKVYWVAQYFYFRSIASQVAWNKGQDWRKKANKNHPTIFSQMTDLSWARTV